MGVVYFSIIPTFEPSRYYKCWIVCFYNRKKQVRIQDEAFKDKTRYMYRYKYKNSIKLYFCNNYVRKITGKSYGFFSEIIIYYEL